MRVAPVVEELATLKRFQITSTLSKRLTNFLLNWKALITFSWIIFPLQPFPFYKELILEPWGRLGGFKKPWVFEIWIESTFGGTFKEGLRWLVQLSILTTVTCKTFLLKKLPPHWCLIILLHLDMFESSIVSFICQICYFMTKDFMILSALSGFDKSWWLTTSTKVFLDATLSNFGVLATCFAYKDRKGWSFCHLHDLRVPTVLRKSLSATRIYPTFYHTLS